MTRLERALARREEAWQAKLATDGMPPGPAKLAAYVAAARVCAAAEIRVREARRAGTQRPQRIEVRGGDR